MIQAQTGAALARLLEEEISILTELSQLLEREHSIIATRQPVDVLDQACQLRQLRMGALLNLEEERRSLLRAANLPDTHQGIDQLLTNLSEGPRLRQRWKKALELASRCRDLNDRNGALVAARLRRVEGMLEVMTGDVGSPRVYGPRGALTADRNGRMLTAEA